MYVKDSSVQATASVRDTLTIRMITFITENDLIYAYFAHLFLLIDLAYKPTENQNNRKL